MRSNRPLSRAWYLKEDVQRFWDYVREGWAEKHLKQWLWWASHSRLEPFRCFARLVRTYLDGILAWDPAVGQQRSTEGDQQQGQDGQPSQL